MREQISLFLNIAYKIISVQAPFVNS